MRAILMYHSIDGSGSPISVTPDVFRSHMRFLASGRVRVLPLMELLDVPDSTDAVAITFDDGFVNFQTEALPELTATALHATVFVVSDHVGGTNAWGGHDSPGIPTLPLMSWQSLAVVRTGGIEIGAHTRTHRDLAVLPPAAIEEELASGAERIAAELGMKPVSFAYPYGSTSAAAVQAARRYFHVACGTELRVLSASDDPVQLPRLDAYYFRSPGQLEAWGSRPFRQRLWFRAQGRRVRRLVQPVTRTM